MNPMNHGVSLHDVELRIMLNLESSEVACDGRSRATSNLFTRYNVGYIDNTTLDPIDKELNLFPIGAASLLELMLAS